MADKRDILHVGQISSVNVETASARAAFDDLQGLTSAPMQIVFPAMGKWQMFCVPKVGDHVNVLRLPNGKSEGFILGTSNTANNMPQNPKDGLVQLISDDLSCSIRLDADSGTLEVLFKESISEKSKERKITAEQSIEISAEEITVRAPKIKLVGEVEIEGNLKVTGNIENDGNMTTSGQHTDAAGTHC